MISQTDEAWYATFKPFGEVASLTANPAVMNLRFPGQWFQMETGLAYNWHRHYDPTTGRYLQADPLLSDENGRTIGGIAQGTIPDSAPDGHAIARKFGWAGTQAIVNRTGAERPMLQDGASLYGYAGQEPLMMTDASGLATMPKGSAFSSVPQLCEKPGREMISKAFFPANDNLCSLFSTGTPTIDGSVYAQCNYMRQKGPKKFVFTLYHDGDVPGSCLAFATP